ncbi:hypothetical protein HMPREF3188_01057 [Tissierellia bacterium KA00581]|nr:hypothetical protein HMPREF3188_01057 [Tissierellia bacterium KA00581]
MIQDVKGSTPTLIKLTHTDAPRTKEPSVVISAIFKILKLIKSPIDKMPNKMP